MLWLGAGVSSGASRVRPVPDRNFENPPSLLATLVTPDIPGMLMLSFDSSSHGAPEEECCWCEAAPAP